jgi:hypothetical protein
MTTTKTSPSAGSVAGWYTGSTGQAARWTLPGEPGEPWFGPEITLPRLRAREAASDLLSQLPPLLVTYFLMLVPLPVTCSGMCVMRGEYAVSRYRCHVARFEED